MLSTEASLFMNGETFNALNLKQTILKTWKISFVLYSTE